MLTKLELGVPGVSNTAPTGYVQLVQGNPRDPEPETASAGIMEDTDKIHTANQRASMTARLNEQFSP